MHAIYLSIYDLCLYLEFHYVHIIIQVYERYKFDFDFMHAIYTSVD